MTDGTQFETKSNLGKAGDVLKLKLILNLMLLGQVATEAYG